MPPMINSHHLPDRIHRALWTVSRRSAHFLVAALKRDWTSDQSSTFQNALT